ncbi:MAG: hypothetical protein WBF75_25760 [Pseudonocardiaceae bacterium]
MPGHHLFHRLQLLVAQLRPAEGLGGHPLELVSRRTSHDHGRYPDLRQIKR